MSPPDAQKPLVIYLHVKFRQLGLTDACAYYKLVFHTTAHSKEGIKQIPVDSSSQERTQNMMVQRSEREMVLDKCVAVVGDLLL